MASKKLSHQKTFTSKNFQNYTTIGNISVPTTFELDQLNSKVQSVESKMAFDTSEFDRINNRIDSLISAMETLTDKVKHIEEVVDALTEDNEEIRENIKLELTPIKKQLADLIDNTTFVDAIGDTGHIAWVPVGEKHPNIFKPVAHKNKKSHRTTVLTNNTAPSGTVNYT